MDPGKGYPTWVNARLSMISNGPNGMTTSEDSPGGKCNRLLSGPIEKLCVTQMLWSYRQALDLGFRQQIGLEKSEGVQRSFPGSAALLGGNRPECLLFRCHDLIDSFERRQ